jgi:hypothetical protein
MHSTQRIRKLEEQSLWRVNIGVLLLVYASSQLRGRWSTLNRAHLLMREFEPDWRTLGEIFLAGGELRQLRRAFADVSEK